METYIILFSAKFIENTISTLRIIVVSHGRKVMGAILNFVIAIIWSISTGIIVTNFNNPLNIFFFALGCCFGSYAGSIMQEKINNYKNK